MVRRGTSVPRDSVRIPYPGISTIPREGGLEPHQKGGEWACRPNWRGFSNGMLKKRANREPMSGER